MVLIKLFFEYQLFNIVDVKSIKVLVPENNFPDNQVIINQFNLDLFDTFKIAITKDEFKKAFGIEFRPGKEDILYFCQTNRMYIVKHAQIHKDIMGAGIYYDVILEKYEKRANVINRIQESKDKIDALTRNTTIDELFGADIKEQQDKIGNKEQTKPLSFDFNRKLIHKNIIYNKTSLTNGVDNDIIRNYYTLSNVPDTEVAVVYNNKDNDLKISDNRLFTFWFNIPNKYGDDMKINSKVLDSYNIPNSKIFNMINNYSDDGLGYKIWYQNDKIWFMINDKVFKLSAPLFTNIWYALVINFNQRQGKISIKVFRRQGDIKMMLYHPASFDIIDLDVKTEKTDIEYEINTNGFKPFNNVEEFVIVKKTRIYSRLFF